MTLIQQLKQNLDRGAEYEDNLGELRPPVASVRVIAYYLPQFHPIPENDEWWGKGFTEWTNVTKAIPRFAGHYQPKLPGSLGFYDLRIPDVLSNQAELAKKSGIHGFCFHYYWFSGKKLLEQPLNLFLNHPDIDFPFCINWANENWSRRWDGMDSQILIRQVYSPDDDIAFARSLEGALADKRYIRIEGRPLLMLYRPELLPDAAATIDRWREFFTARGFGNPYFVMPQVFEQLDPTLFGMDAAAGFPPHKFRWDLQSLLPSLERFDPSYHGRVFKYQDLAALAMEFQPKKYKLFHGVCPAWDNCARKPRDGVSFIGSTATIYGRWLANACYKALQDPKPDERIVFINAWNEWGEGAYLEPDRHKGHAYLNETARVISNLNLKALNSKVDGSASVPNLNLDNSSKHLFRKLRTRAANHLEMLTNTIRPR